MTTRPRLRRKRYRQITASTARPLSTQLFLLTGENYTHPWHMKQSKFHKDRFSLYRGAIKKFEVRFIDEVPTPASTRRQSAKVTGAQGTINTYSRRRDTQHGGIK